MADKLNKHLEHQTGTLEESYITSMGNYIQKHRIFGSPINRNSLQIALIRHVNIQSVLTRRKSKDSLIS